MTTAGVKLTVYFGERDRLDGRLASDVLFDLLERHGVRGAVLLRGAEGFGIKHRLRTQRLLTLSEDLPLVATAVDAPEAIEALVREVAPLVGGGLVTLERVRLLGRAERTGALVGDPGRAHGAKLTLYLGRRERVDGRGAAAFAVDVLRRHGVSGATVLLGVDGLVHHVRRRARFFSRNEDVPLLVESVGPGVALGRAVAELETHLDDLLATVEKVVVCKRDGVTHALPAQLPDSDDEGLGIWQKLVVHASELARHGRHPLYVELIHRLRLEGAAGATAVRGVWGFSGDHPPHGDRLLAVRRDVPVVVTVVDRPGGIRRWWNVVDEVTSQQGLVTSEVVPAFRAVGPGIAAGGLALARLDP